MRSYTRHQLKQDSFTTSTAETITWARDNRAPVIVAAVVVVVILALIGGGWAFINYRDAQAKSDMSLATAESQCPVRPAGTPAEADVLSYGSTQERDQATNADFTRIANKYTYTQTGRMARYFSGITIVTWATPPLLRRPAGSLRQPLQGNRQPRQDGIGTGRTRQWKEHAGD